MGRIFKGQRGLLLALLGGALRLEDNTLQLFKDGEVLVGVINLGVSLFFGEEEADFLEALEFALDVAGVFFDQFGQAADMRPEVGVLGIYHYDFPSDSGCNKYV